MFKKPFLVGNHDGLKFYFPSVFLIVSVELQFQDKYRSLILWVSFGLGLFCDFCSLWDAYVIAISSTRVQRRPHFSYLPFSKSNFCSHIQQLEKILSWSIHVGHRSSSMPTCLLISENPLGLIQQLWQLNMSIEHDHGKSRLTKMGLIPLPMFSFSQ